MEDIRELRKKIALLEWDMPNIQNKKIRLYKKKLIEEYKKQIHTHLSEVKNNG